MPNYDKYDVDDMIRELSQAKAKEESFYRDRKSVDEIKSEFFSFIQKQTRILEQDLFEARS